MKYSAALPIVLVCTLSVTIASPAFPFRDTRLPWEMRVDDLVSRLTVDELISQMVYLTNVPQPAVKRLGIPSYVALSECWRGLVEYNTTAFPQVFFLINILVS